MVAAPANLPVTEPAATHAVAVGQVASVSAVVAPGTSCIGDGGVLACHRPFVAEASRPTVVPPAAASEPAAAQRVTVGHTSASSTGAPLGAACGAGGAGADRHRSSLPLRIARASPVPLPLPMPPAGGADSMIVHSAVAGHDTAVSSAAVEPAATGT